MVTPAPAATVGRLFDRPEARLFDLLDLALADEMLRVIGYGALELSTPRPGVVTVHANGDQAALLQAVCWDTTPSAMESWMLSLAPRLVAAVVEITGSAWVAEAELSVELCLSVRADDMADFAERLAAGPVDLDGSRSAAAVIAPDVPDPALVHFV